MAHSRERRSPSCLVSPLSPPTASGQRDVSVSERCEKTCNAPCVSPFSRMKTSASPSFLLSNWFLIFLLFSLFCVIEGAKPKEGRPVTYGSAVSLVHVLSGFKLFSGKISWGSGSGQQAVTATPSGDKAAAANMLWIVSAPPSGMRRQPLDSPVMEAQMAGSKSSASSEPAPALVTPGAAGEPVRCGSVIFLEHGSSRGTLQATGASSPISSQKEVSVGAGRDTRVAGFKLVCANTKSEMWLTGDIVTFEHVRLGTNLQAKKDHQFTQQNCGRGCPIAGHIEVSVSNEKPRSSWGWSTPPDQWKASAGLMVNKEGEGLFDDLGFDHDEL
ncbi:putative transmembrane protein [Toxoplasma gondii GAB2-2007-GAL-DOM2]|uniref:MIR domain-containing protein n=9 Tax=Toxoplasma gondii TaxID=5811 RepID=S7W631_TOXGG|nr:hypothetical protein TGGT1_228630 [Toxoplasma gondii GT1]ESS32793.1 putative transmembrane protein [Toxoplasma gondii VEG]KAF4640858.1 hypothetical protein TGRH88_047840 [Toxoplasma gondii]KFG44915.1 putative transmembrane protein [Toxoplasma gondii GAB2-2007-GAL-DOM2]KFG52249.1 putative transmembrane protein [Toxoplasma gondii FOU]PUA90910.1 putative transmembrane protein [Toxoplasma gondii TgCATBr9]